MSKNFENNDKYIDDLLAEFADQVVDGKSPQITDSPQETTFRDLQEVILAIHDSVSVENPDVQTADRIKQNLLEEWKSGAAKRESWLDKIFPRKQTDWSSTAQRRGILAVQIAAAVVAVLIIFVSVVPSTGPLTGAASGESDLTLPFFLLLVLAGSYFWWTRRNK